MCKWRARHSVLYEIDGWFCFEVSVAGIWLTDIDLQIKGIIWYLATSHIKPIISNIISWQMDTRFSRTVSKIEKNIPYFKSRHLLVMEQSVGFNQLVGKQGPLYFANPDSSRRINKYLQIYGGSPHTLKAYRDLKNWNAAKSFLIKSSSLQWHSKKIK